jgi:hypothetical protein
MQNQQGLHVRLDLSTGQRMGKLMDPEEAAADSSGGANATGGGEHVVILDAGEGGKKQAMQQRKRLRVEEEGTEEPVRSEGEVSGPETRSPQETMEAVLLQLPGPERASMGIDDLHAVCMYLIWLGLRWKRTST